MSAGSPGRREALAAAGTALLSACVGAANLLRPDARRLDLPNHDLFAEFLPRMHYAGEALARGELPLWDPYQAAGLPFLATLQAGLLYPPNWIHALLPTPAALALLALLHLAAAAAAAFALARSFGSSAAAAALTGLAYGAGGTALFLGQHANAVSSLPWLPLQLLLVRRLARAPSPRAAALLALALALQFLAGRDYTTVMSLHCAALLACCEALWLWRDAGPGRVARFGASLLLAGALAAGLSAAQLLPTLELAGQGLRTLSGPPAAQLESFGRLPFSLLVANLVYPYPGGLRREYLGWIPLACFGLSLGRVGRDRAASFAALLAALAVPLALGSSTPLYGWYRELPLAALFRLPDRFVFLLSLALALGAGRGLDLLLDRGPDPVALSRGVRIAGLLAAALLLALASGALGRALGALWEADWGWTWFHGFEPFHFRGLPWTAAALAASAFSLALARRFAGARRAPGAGLVALAAADLLLTLRSPFLHPLLAPGHAVAGAACFERAAPLLGQLGRVLVFRLPDSHALEDKAGELFRIFSATHYEPLMTRRHALYFGLLEQTPPAPEAASPRTPFTGALDRLPPASRRALLDLLGVRALLLPARVERGSGDALEGLPLRGECVVPSLGGPARIAIRENPGALPRAFLAERVARADGPEQARDRLAAPDFDPRSEVILEARELPAEPPAAEGAPAAGPGRVSVLQYGPERIELRTQSPRPAWLVLADSFFPGWQVEVDGAPAPLFAADLLFRGVPVPAGPARVVFEYRPRSFRRGLAGSAAGLAAGAVCLLWPPGNRRGSRGRA